MQIIIAKEAGFCFGVKRAFELANNCAENKNKLKYSLGPLIHNRHVVDELSRKGIQVIDDLSQAEQGSCVIIRSHGVGPETLRKAQSLNLDIVDATCPFVAKAQIYNRGIQPVLIGDKNHPEVMGINEWAQGKLIVIKDAEEAKKIELPPKIGILAQTTQTRENFNSIVNILMEKCQEAIVYNSICNATKERQKSTVELAGKVDVMVVIGGKNSANTAKLTALSKSQGTPTYQIESADELEAHWFKGIKTAGITAGASTPQWIIEEVERRMKELDQMVVNENEAVVVESEIEAGPEIEPTVVDQSEATVAKTDEMPQESVMTNAMDITPARPGEIVNGVVVQVSPDEVLVDIGAKSEGIIPLRELSSFDVSSPEDIVKVGDNIDVMVIKPEDKEGKIVLSKIKADAEKTWSNLEQIMESGQTTQGIVKEVVKGGLLVDIGIRAFLPASLVDRGYIEDLSVLLGQNITTKVIELDREKKKVILSRKIVLEEEHEKKKKELLENLKENQTVKGIVKRLTSFGAFVDIGGIDGLLHVSEIAWHRVSHPADVLNINDEVEVMVLRVDKENEKISLGMKQLLPNPWDNVEEKYPVGKVLKTKVVRIAPFGAFVQLEPGVEGLVHISHLSVSHVEKTEEVVQEGQEVDVKVLSVDAAAKRIRLSIREAAAVEDTTQAT